MKQFNGMVNASAAIGLPSIRQLQTKYPCDKVLTKHIEVARKEVRNILDAEDDRLMVVIGPCSIHDSEAGLHYAERLAETVKNYAGHLQLVMRCYFEKPRTTVGWKGMIFDPYLDGSDDLETGLLMARRLLSEVNHIGLPCATEFLDLTSFMYLADLISWGAIGARTTESQWHRQMASGLPCPVGFKNGTDGNLTIAADAMQSSANGHLYPVVSPDGGLCAVKSKGNATTHAIMRGGVRPNYYPHDIEAAVALLKHRKLNSRLMIDCSHGNSRKQHANQLKVAESIAAQMAEGNDNIAAVMAESFIIDGKQSVIPGRKLTFGQSITDACLSWQDTINLLDTLAEGVESRRHMHQLQRCLA